MQVKKVFDVACTLIDVISCVPLQTQSLQLEPRDFLHQFIHLINRLRGGRERYLPLLLSKVNDSLPHLPMGGSVPHGLTTLPSSITGQSEKGLEDVTHLQNSSPTGRTNDETEENSDFLSNSPQSTNPGGRSPYEDSAINATLGLKTESSYIA